MAKKKKLGRKPAADPKVEMRIYPNKSWVDRLGFEEARELAVKTIEKAAKKK